MVMVEVKVSVALFHVHRNESPWKAELVSNPPESADADPRNTIWSHTFAERNRRLFLGESQTEAGRQGVFPVLLTREDQEMKLIRFQENLFQSSQ